MRKADQTLRMYAKRLTFWASPVKTTGQNTGFEIQMALVVLDFPLCGIKILAINGEIDCCGIRYAHHELIGFGKAVSGFGVGDRFGFVKAIDEYIILKSARPNSAFLMCATHTDAAITQSQ